VCKSVYEISKKLTEFWIEHGATPIFPYNMYIGAGTFHPKCFFSSISQQKSAYVYTQKSTRKSDGRYGESPNRLLNHHQLQVIFTPGPQNIKQLFLDSLQHIGINLSENFIQFNDNNWENISIGAIGVGWEVLCNNTEICQFTYFQKMGDEPTHFNTVELAYGIERLAFVLFKKSIFETIWHGECTYGDIFLQDEQEFSKYFLEKNQPKETEFHSKHQEALQLIEEKLYRPAYEILLQMIDIFNSLDARKLISQIQRKELIAVTRSIANNICKAVNSID
jgi:glycyl-tRNA synthetase alpha chain